MSQRKRMLQQAVVNGTTLFGELDEHTQPEITKKMEDDQGGKFIPGQMMVGIDALKASIKVLGASTAVLKTQGLKQGELVQIDIKESQEDKDGSVYAVHYSYTCEVTSVKEDPAKMGSKPGHTIEWVPTAYKKTENGEVVYNINTDTQEIDLGNGDIMAEHRRNVGR